MFDDLKGKNALITGSGKRSGIGYAIAEKLAACGVNIIIADIGVTITSETGLTTGAFEEMEEIAKSLKEKYGVEALPVTLDVTDHESIGKMTEMVSKGFGRVDILVNNAGAAIGVPADVKNYDDAAWIKTVDINLHGVFRVSKALLPLMTGTRGSIINMASRAGKVPPLFNGAYAVAKAGVIMLTKVLALELAEEGIWANAICPGLIMTEMQSMRIDLEAKFFNTSFEEQKADLAKRVPMGMLGEPGDVASLVAYLSSKESSYITGQAINICGGQTMEL